MSTAANDSLLARAMAQPESEDAAARQILDAALEQFTIFGLRRSTVDDVAKRAGVSRVTVYRRFQSKDSLVEACLMREYRRFLAELDAAVAQLPAMEDRVVEGFVVALRYTRGHPLIGGLLRLEPEVMLPFLTVGGGPALIAMREYLSGHLRRAQRVEGRPESDPEPVAELAGRCGSSARPRPASRRTE